MHPSEIFIDFSRWNDHVRYYIFVSREIEREGERKRVCNRERVKKIHAKEKSEREEKKEREYLPFDIS